MKKIINSKERVKLAFDHIEPDKIPTGELAINHKVSSYILKRVAWTGCGGYICGKKFIEMLLKGKHEEYRKRILDDEMELNKVIENDIFIVSPKLKNPVPPIEVKENIWKFGDKDNDQWQLYQYLPQFDIYGEIDSNIKEGGIKEFEKYKNILKNKVQDLSANWDFSDIEYVKRKTNNEIFIIGYADVGFPSGSSWLEVFLEAMLTKPEIVDEYLDIQLEITIKSLKIQFDIGVDGIWGGEDWAYKSGLLFSPKLWNYFIKNRLKIITDFCHQNNVVYIKHCDGNLNSVIKEFLSEAGIDCYQAIEPRASMDIGYLKKKFGDKVTLWGNVDCAKTLVSGIDDEIISETKEVIKKTAQGGGFIFSSSNSISNSIPPENFLLMRKTLKKYGNYPISID